MPEELARQEYLCDFSAANVGAILGRYMEAAEQARARSRSNPCSTSTAAASSCRSDIGFRDTASVLVLAAEARRALRAGRLRRGQRAATPRSGSSALRVEAVARRTLCLPHDARAKTFQSRHSVVEQFLKSQWARERRARAGAEGAGQGERCALDAAALRVRRGQLCARASSACASGPTSGTTSASAPTQGARSQLGIASSRRVLLRRGDAPRPEPVAAHQAAPPPVQSLRHRLNSTICGPTTSGSRAEDTEPR